jgi:hypothetical protein
MNAQPIRLFVVGALAASTLALSIACLAALNGGGALRLGGKPLLELSAGYARPAEKLLAQPAPTSQQAADAAALSRKALAQFPYDNSSWLRLAYADAIRNGRLTPEGAALLRRSYDLTPIDIYAGVWRISFVLENSQAIPRDVRLSAKKEFEALWRDYHKRDDLQQMAVAVRNPAGRLSAALWLNGAKASAAK